MAEKERKPTRKERVKNLAIQYARRDPRFRVFFIVYDTIMSCIRRVVPCFIGCLIKSLTCCLISLDTFEQEDDHERDLMQPKSNELLEDYKKRQRLMKQLRLERNKQLEKRYKLIDYYGGISFGVMCCLFIYFVLVKHHTVTSLTFICSMTLFMALILERSRKFRCILLLALPLLFTNRGRSLVICFVLAMLMNGPVKNTQTNIKELHETLSCSKRYLIVRGREYLDENVLDKILALDDIIINLEHVIREFVDALMRALDDLRENFMIVARSLERMFLWLKRIVDICNEKQNQPFENCNMIFQNAIDDCNIRLGSIFGFLCQLVLPVKQTCYFAKVPNVVCALPAKIADIYEQNIEPELEVMIAFIKEQLYCKINLGHKYSYKKEKSKKIRVVFTEIRQDISDKFAWMRIFSNIFSFLSLIITIWILSRSTLYYMRFKSKLEYDNMYIDNYIYDIERRRSELGMRTVLPLNLLQRSHYRRPLDLSMTDDEIHKLCIAGTVWFCIFNYVTFYLSLDYLLFQLCNFILETLKSILEKELLIETELHMNDDAYQTNKLHEQILTRHHQQQEARINNQTKLANFYIQLGKTIGGSLPNQTSASSALRDCLPKIREPDFATYQCIGYFALFTFLTVIAEAYTLRSRHCIASLYYPSRAKERAVWLYQKLLQEKSSRGLITRMIPFANKPKNVDFFNGARDPLGRLYGRATTKEHDNTIDDENLMRYLTRTCCPKFVLNLLKYIGFFQEGIGCIVCGQRCTLASLEDQDNFIKCCELTQGRSNKLTECNAIYCFQCYEESLFNKCIICNCKIILNRQVNENLQDYKKQKISDQDLGYGIGYTFDEYWQIRDSSPDNSDTDDDDDALMGATPEERSLIVPHSKGNRLFDRRKRSKDLPSFWSTFINDLRMAI